jgi:hypothetical protein
MKGVLLYIGWEILVFLIIQNVFDVNVYKAILKDSDRVSLLSYGNVDDLFLMWIKRNLKVNY